MEDVEYMIAPESALEGVSISGNELVSSDMLGVKTSSNDELVALSNA